MSPKNMDWAGVGFCKSRHQIEANDWCNQPVVKGGEYCRACTCDVRGCREQGSHWWPMLDRRLCRKHDTPEHAPAGAFDPPDDFDIPDGDWS